MSNIPEAREILKAALEEKRIKPIHVKIKHALALMGRERPKFRAVSHKVTHIDKRKKAQILDLRRQHVSVPDIAIMLGVNSRSVSHIINGR